MALKMVKAATAIQESKVEAPQTVSVEPSVEPQAMTEVEALTQEYVTLYRKYVEHEVKDLCKRMEDIRKQLMAYANENGEDGKPFTFECPDGEIDFSERGKNTIVTSPLTLVHDLTEKFGSEVGFSVVNIAMTPLRKILSEMELKKYVKEEPGSRTLKSCRPKKEK